VIAQRMFNGLDSFLILAVPLFLFLGEVMERAKITDRLVEFAESLVGRFRGGLAHVSIVTNAIMADITGSGTADAAATGSVLIPAMTRAGYPLAFSASLVGAAATLGPVFPPSITMVIYGSIANVSIGRLFLGGFVPGIMMMLWLMVIAALMARRRGLAKGKAAELCDIWRATRRAFLVLMTPLILVAGIVGGVFTPTESAAIGSIYALVLGLAVYRTLKFSELLDVVRRSALTTGRLMLILACASVFSWILARADVPGQIAQIPIFADTGHPWVLLMAINVLLLILGPLIEAIPTQVIITPMILPLAIHAGIDPVHLGVVMAMNVSISLIMPPLGPILLVMCGLTGISIVTFLREVWVFIVALFVPLMVATYVPQIVLFLPNLLMGPE
jgi:tripartite ATP-independent transporter DctM subunit